jgi:dihydrofolate synthase/folylpolyglutamate synthase
MGSRTAKMGGDSSAAAALEVALGRLYGRIPLGMRAGLGPMREACAAAGHPEEGLTCVHVAGTNGKGSVCAMVESIARVQGLRTGLYTSPHLCRFAERIRLDGEPIDDVRLTRLLHRALDIGSELSFFEVATLAAFFAFEEARPDIVVLEVGLGGRLDATNVIPTPRAAAITRIALDHADRLGPRLVDIAREKAGIAKRGLDIVVGGATPEVRAAIDEVARSHGATTSGLEGVSVPGAIGLAGEHQQENARIAAALGARIGASRDAVREGIAATRWPGRLERIGRFLLDAAHNPDGAEALARHLRALAVPPADVALVFGVLADKDWAPMLDALAPLAKTRCYVAPAAAARRSADPAAMAARHPGDVVDRTPSALSRFVPGGAGGASDAGESRLPSLVVVAGSIVLVGEARGILLGLPRDPPVAL